MKDYREIISTGEILNNIEAQEEVVKSGQYYLVKWMAQKLPEDRKKILGELAYKYCHTHIEGFFKSEGLFEVYFQKLTGCKLNLDLNFARTLKLVCKDWSKERYTTPDFQHVIPKEVMDLILRYMNKEKCEEQGGKARYNLVLLLKQMCGVYQINVRYLPYFEATGGKIDERDGSCTLTHSGEVMKFMYKDVDITFSKEAIAHYKQQLAYIN